MQPSLLSIVERRLASAANASLARYGGELSICGAGVPAVVVTEHHVGAEHAVAFLAPITDEECVDPRDMLRLCATLGAGAIALVGTSYVVRFAVPAAQLETAPLVEILAYVRALAARLAVARKSSPDVSALAFMAA